MKVALLAQAALWGDAVLLFSIARYARRHKEVDAASVTTLSALGFVGRVTIWAAAVLLAAQNMGVNVTAMVAGLGIGGVAVALAAQNVLGDLFASASIVLDKPFVLGDFIVVGDEMGSVEYIGLKTTRLRSLSGEQLIFSNTDLLKSRIHNYKRMAERRVLFTVGVEYDTPYEKVAAIPAMLRQCIEAQKPIRFDRAHFARYGDSALIFEVVYYVLSADYNVYMDVQQAINLHLFRRFAEEKIEFAFPTRTVYQRQIATAATGRKRADACRVVRLANRLRVGRIGAVGLLPAHHHVRLDRLARTFQVGAGVLHVEADGVQLVAGGLGQAVAGGRAGIGRAADAQGRLRDHPGVARPPRDAQRRLLRIAFSDHLGGGCDRLRPR